MMSLYRNQVSLLLLLLLMASPLLHSYLFAHAASTSPTATRPPIKFVTGLRSDANYEDDETYNPPPKVTFSADIPVVFNAPHPCKFDPCLENQVPCSQLADETGCLCPGRSGVDEPPRPPVVQGLQTISEGDNKGKAEVLWCAPSSAVSTYRVVVERSSGDPLEYGEALRRGLVGFLEDGTKVCVEAVNSVGHSPMTEHSCARYNRPKTSEHDLLAWIIGGAVALLLLVAVTAVILWKKKVCQKGKRDSADGLGNPSYSTEGTL